MNCPLYHVYLDRHRNLVGRAHRSVGLRRSSFLQAASVELRKAQIERAKCHTPAYGIHPRPRRFQGRRARLGGDRLADFTSYGAMYGGCGHCGTPKCPSGEYGGCGTFFGKTKDGVKRACYLEKKIAKHQKCCDSDCSWWSGKGNQANQCRKIAEWNAELAAIQMAEFGPQTYEQATDIQAQQYQTEIAQGDEQYRMEQAQTQRTLLIVGGGVGLALLAVMALR